MSTETSYLQIKRERRKGGYNNFNPGLCDFEGKHFMNPEVGGISHHPEEVSTTHSSSASSSNWSWEVFRERAAQCLEASDVILPRPEWCVCFFLSPLQSVISGVGRGASSRPHRWHSCPCSTHNTKPLVAWQSTHIPAPPSLVIQLLIFVWFPLWLLINA